MTGEATVLVSGVAVGPSEDPTHRLGLLFDAHHARLYRLARRLSRNQEDARDLLQDTFLRAAGHVARVPTGTNHEEAWLVRVMINICRDRWRQAASRARHDAAVSAARPEPSGDPESAVVARSIVWRALRTLPPRRRAVLVMHELEGSTISAIARTLGVSAVTVRWHLSVGRRQLAHTIETLEKSWATLVHD